MQGLAAYTTVLTEQLLNRYYPLHNALASLNRQLAGATPTIADLLPIETLFLPFSRAVHRLITCVLLPRIDTILRLISRLPRLPCTGRTACSTP